MAPVVLTADEQATAMKAGSSELKYLFAREGIPEKYQALFYHHQVISMAKLSNLAETTAELKTLLRDDFGIDSATGITERVIVSSIIVAFNASKSRTDKVNEVEGEYDVKRMLKPLAASDFHAMRSAWESKYWSLEDSEVPGRSYLERRLEELEAGDMRAESLTTVLSRDEDTADVFTSFWDSTGQLQLRKGGSVVPEPSNTEVFRKRLKLLFVGLQFLGLRHTNRAFLQGITPQDCDRYLNYLLGEHVWLLAGRASDGSTVTAPLWAQLLLYEHAIRRRAWHLVQTTGQAFKECLKDAYACPVTKERNFTTPVALSSASKRPLTFNDLDSKRFKGEGKGSKGGKGGKGGSGGKNGSGGKAGKGGKGGKNGKGGKGGKGDKKLCFAFNNNWEKCTRKNCPFEHSCSKCGGKHPLYQCTNAEAPAGETQSINM